VRVWNGSFDAPAVGLPVRLGYLSFGAATTLHHIGTRFVDLGVKGSSKHPAFAFFDWRTPEAGHYCLQARLDWSDDANPDNNLGQENVNVGVAASPAQFELTLRNEAAVRRRFVLAPDVYRLPKLAPCPEEERPERRQTRLAESRARWERARREQGTGQFAVPNGWTVTIEPSELVLAACEEQQIAVSVDIPQTTPTATLNVNALALHEDGRELVGGVTLQVERA
jgi:hypothetical protein